MRLRATVLIGLTLAMSAWCVRPAAGEETLSYVDLVGQLVSLERLATLPAPGETCRQWSSYDRHSRYDEVTGKYVAWDANGDGTGCIRKEGDKIVMAEMEGPGCIWRSWSAKAEDGHVKIYLDGSETPAVDLPFRQYFSGDTAPFNYPMLSHDLNKLGCSGQNLYYPIPYQKSCKIVADPGWGRYYQFDYVTYPKGTKVPTFQTKLSAEDAAALKKVNDFLTKDLGKDPAGDRAGQASFREAVLAPAGRSFSVELDGPRAITAFRAKMDCGSGEEARECLRKVVLKITWDDQSEPAVWCPVGDFFGTAPAFNQYKSLVTGVTGDGGYALWYMPFGKKARIEIENPTGQDRRLSLDIAFAPLEKPMDELAYFHCKWHRDVKELSEDRWPDWVMLQTEGRGRFCGVMLHVWNPAGGWWGEGDEKFFVDGEKMPSFFGTGSEDYFGYAWCHPGRFERPFHGQTMTEKNQGHQSVFRWQVVDSVPFQKSFEGTIEKYYSTEEKGTKYACVTAWYLAKGGKDPYGQVPVDQRHGYYDKVTPRAGGFEVLEKTGGNVQTQGMSSFGKDKWKKNDQLWWTGAKPGDKIVLKVPTKRGGPQEVSVLLTKARDYGIVQFWLDGKKVGKPVDLYNPDVIPTEPISLGTHDLTAGDHELGVEIVGANPAALKAYMFGLDYVIFDGK